MHCHRRITSVAIRPLDSHDDVMHAHADLGGRKFITRFDRRAVNAYAKQLLIGKWDEDIATRRATVRTHQLGRILREVRATVGGLEPHGISRRDRATAMTRLASQSRSRSYVQLAARTISFDVLDA